MESEESTPSIEATIAAQSYSLDEIAKQYIRYPPRGIHLSIEKQQTTIERRALFAVSGLGDLFDVFTF